MKTHRRLLFALFSLCLLALGLAGCGEKPAFDLDSLEPPMETELNTLPGASMEVLRLEADSLLVQIRYQRPDEDAAHDITTGEGFWLDYCYEGQWYAVPLAEGKVLAFTDICYAVPSHHPRNYAVPFGSLYDPLPPGLYRVVKGANFRGGSSGFLAAEFTVD